MWSSSSSGSDGDRPPRHRRRLNVEFEDETGAIRRLTRAELQMYVAVVSLEGRIALEEVLDRFPEWHVDLSKARMSTTSTVRGWETVPAYVA